MVLAASYLVSLSMLITNLQPVILGALADNYGFSNRELGYLSAMLVGATTLCIATAPGWIRTANWHLLSFACLIIGTLACLTGMLASTFGQFLLLFAVLGAVKGVLGVPSFATLGDTRNPDRNFGISAVIQGIHASLFVWPVSAYVIPEFGVTGMWVVIALGIGSGLLCARLIPRRGAAEAVEGADEPPAAGVPLLSRAAIPAFAMLFAMAVFSGGLVGFWYFVERIGVSMGVEPSVIGLTLSLGSLASILSAGIVAWFSERFSSLAFACIGTCSLLACFTVLQIPSDFSFIAANVFFSLGWGLTQPPYWAILRKVDRTNRLFVTSPVAAGAASVGIGLMAGPIIEGYGFGGMIAFCAIAVILALLITLGVLTATRLSAPAPQAA